MYVQQRAEDPGDLLCSLKTLQEWYRMVQRARRQSRSGRERRDCRQDGRNAKGRWWDIVPVRVAGSQKWRSLAHTTRRRRKESCLGSWGHCGRVQGEAAEATKLRTFSGDLWNAQMGMAQVPYLKQVLVELLMCASDERVMHGRSTPTQYKCGTRRITNQLKTRKRHKGEHKITVSEI